MVAQPQDIKSHFLAHAGMLRGKKGRKLAIGTWECVVWVLWKARNNFIFDGKEWSPSAIIGEVKNRLWSWCLIKKVIDCNASLQIWFSDPTLLI